MAASVAVKAKAAAKAKPAHAEQAPAAKAKLGKAKSVKAKPASAKAANAKAASPVVPVAAAGSARQIDGRRTSLIAAIASAKSVAKRARLEQKLATGDPVGCARCRFGNVGCDSCARP